MRAAKGSRSIARPDLCAATALSVFAHDLPPEKRTDRVIAEEWDAAFALFDGDPTAADIARLAANVPRQEAGRVSEKEIVLARANKSVRLFDHVASCLAAGQSAARRRLSRRSAI